MSSLCNFANIPVSPEDPRKDKVRRQHVVEHSGHFLHLIRISAHQMGWLSPRRALCGGEVLLTSVPFGVEWKKTHTHKIGRTGTGIFPSDESLLKVIHLKVAKAWMQHPEATVSVTADLRSDDGWGGGRVELSPAPTLRLSRWRRGRREEEDLSTLSLLP